MARSDSANPTAPLAAWVRGLLSVVLIVHVVAVFTGPWAAFAPRPAAGQPRPDEYWLAGSFAAALRPYLEMASLANGYRFFAPEPGPSHLIRYEATLADGTRVEGFFPNRAVQRPRVLYHRYFMLSEFVNTIDNPDTPAEVRDAVIRSYTEHLAHELQARDVKLYLRRHFVPRMKEVREGLSLTDPSLYIERPLTVSTGGAK